jgi:hypothetical protein
MRITYYTVVTRRGRKMPKPRRTGLKAWYFSTTEKKLRYNDGRDIALGVTHTVKGKPVPCTHGLHGSMRILDAVKYAPGPVVWEVELGGTIVEHDDRDKHAATERTYLRGGIDVSDTLRAFARWAALSVAHLWDMPIVVQKFLETGDKKLANAAYANAAAYAANAAYAAYAANAAAAAAANAAAYAAANANAYAAADNAYAAAADAANATAAANANAYAAASNAYAAAAYAANATAAAAAYAATAAAAANATAAATAATAAAYAAYAANAAAAYAANAAAYAKKEELNDKLLEMVEARIAEATS